MSVINLRGTNGSGKSTIVRELMKLDRQCSKSSLNVGTAPPGSFFALSVPIYHLPKFHTIVLGSYDTQCGGADGITTQDEVVSAVIEAAKIARHVIFEGIIISTIFSRYFALSKKLKKELGQSYFWAFLDTPLDICLARVQARNNGAVINTEKVAGKVKEVEIIRGKALAAGEQVITIDHKHPMDWILGEIK